MARRRFPSIFEEIIKRMRREMQRGFPFSEEGESWENRFWNPFEDMMERFEEQPEKLEDFIEEEETPTGKVRKFGPFVYGFSYSKKPGEEPEVQEFGNVRPGRQGKIEPTPGGEREPLTEIIDLNGKYEITIEIPGVEKDEIELSATEDSIRVETTGERKYQKTISLDEPIDPDEIDANFKYGILTVEVNKKEEEQGEGKKIDIK